MSKVMSRAPALALVAMLVGAGCNDSEPMRLATYNAGLAPGFVELSRERAPQTTAAVADLPVDALCVQELWLDEDFEQVRQLAATNLPNAVSLPPEPGEPAGGADVSCRAGEIEPLLACTANQCADVEPGRLAPCVLEACADEFGEMSATCQGCLAANLGRDPDDIVETCAGGPGDQFAYEGSYGLALLTSGEILEENVLRLESSLNRRAVLHALVDFETGPIHLFCTHLTPAFPVDGFAEEQAQQIQALLEFVDQQAGPEGPAVIMGDLNTGPAAGDAVGEIPANYGRLLAAGFFNPYVQQPDPRCTFCPQNPLVDDEAAPVIIDHILLRDFEPRMQARRILADEITVEADGVPVETALSDHYGLLLELE